MSYWDEAMREAYEEGRAFKRESEWDGRAVHGIPQFLPNPMPVLADPKTQIDWGLNYAEQRREGG